MAESTPPTDQRKLKLARTLRRKAIMLAIGSGLGLFCQFAPPDKQEVCHWAARIMGLFMGSP